MKFEVSSLLRLRFVYSLCNARRLCVCRLCPGDVLLFANERNVTEHPSSVTFANVVAAFGQHSVHAARSGQLSPLPFGRQTSSGAVVTVSTR